MTFKAQRPAPFFRPVVTPAMADAAASAIRNGHLGPGPICEEFAAALCERVGREYCVLTTSGTQALALAAHALGVRPGAEILIPAYGVVAVPNAFRAAGYRVRMVDVDISGNMDPEALQRAISTHTGAVCFVDFTGATRNAGEIRHICRHHGVPLIEDACCAIGRPGAGLYGDVAVLSFSVPKDVTCGQGGAILTDNVRVAESARDWIDHDRAHDHAALGTNLRMTDIQAAVGLASLRDLARKLEQRRAVAEVFRKALSSKYLGYADPPLHHVVFDDDPDALVARLATAGIDARRQYAVVSEYQAHRDTTGERAMAREFADTAVYLPFSPSLTVEQAAHIAEMVIADRAAA